MPKLLKSYTIVPPNLYVPRAADRQIQDIIEDMGRPGYVLVSRQMGKTNLLLNAKRRLESINDVFLYIDLSNPFQDARSCFENIIDTALEINESRFEQVKDEIIKKRQLRNNLPPHKQHTNELRLLLKCIPGRFVIILDEIDALTKTDYSDLIFAQIRSIYFTRVNFQEFSKLTYILSGVIEPIEIIKDPKISPFNIGEKIYLSDFNYYEFENFIKNSNLNLSEEIRQRIFYWANGNPRMTWDICAAIESNSVDGNIDVSTIDKTIREFYLTNFDKPPIDNIRELVKHDKEIRNAVIEISYNKEKEISDKIKSKLYLAGIINFTKDSISIKNQIIRESLNINWLNSLEQDQKSQFQIALEHFSKSEYRQCIEAFEKVIHEEDFEIEEKATYYLYLGESYYREKIYDKALANLEAAKFNLEDEPKLFYRRLNLKGTVLFKMGRIQESLATLRLIIDSGRRDIEYAQALINYGATLMESKEQAQLEEAMILFSGVINGKELEHDKLKQEFITEIKSIAHNYLARIQTHFGNIPDAEINYRKALELCKIEEKPPILLYLYDIVTDVDDKTKLIHEIIDIIITNSLKPDHNDTDRANNYKESDLRYILYLSFSSNDDLLFERISQYAFDGSNTVFSEYMYESILYVFSLQKSFEAIIPPLEKLYDKIESGSVSYTDLSKFDIVKFISYVLGDSEKREALIEKYITLYEEINRDILDIIDIRLFELHIERQLTKNNYQQSLDNIQKLKARKDKVTDEHVLSHYFFVQNLEMYAYHGIGDHARMKDASVEIISMSKNPTLLKNGESALGKNNLRAIIEGAERVSTLNSNIRRPIVVENKIGRNEKVKVRYRSGQTVTNKYKNVEEDIKKGECFIVE